MNGWLDWLALIWMFVVAPACTGLVFGFVTLELAYRLALRRQRRRQETADDSV